jgi:hypothetical protein
MTTSLEPSRSEAAGGACVWLRVGEQLDPGWTVGAILSSAFRKPGPCGGAPPAGLEPAA